MNNCWFCDIRPASENANITVELHKIVGGIQSITYPIIGVKEVNYKRETIIVPRCQVCMDRHNKQKIIGLRRDIRDFFIGLATIAAGISIGFATCRIIHCESVWLGIIAGVAGGILMGMFFSWLSMKWKLEFGSSIKKEAEYIQYPPIDRMLKQGWSIGEKPIL